MPTDEIRILNIRTMEHLVYGQNAILVDRGTPWGNPFILTDESNRNDVCDKFEKYARWRLTIEPTWLDPLKDKHLVCHCTPNRCHAETLRKLANSMTICIRCQGRGSLFDLDARNNIKHSVCSLCNGLGIINEL